MYRIVLDIIVNICIAQSMRIHTYTSARTHIQVFKNEVNK